MIHGGIDGFSRLLVFLQASPNNMKSTVLRHFLAATSIYGLPSRVRVDHGGENNDICDLMELLQGRGRGSAIRGTSVHNQRIERVWVDTWNGATNLYYDLFHFLEHQGYLDINNQNHMWALHYVFLPRINRELQAFVAQWNNHGLRTEHYQTPVQLFVGRSLELANTDLTAMNNIFREADSVSTSGVDGIEWNESASGTVDVSEVSCPISAQAVLRLQQTVDPLCESPDLGIDLYLQVCQFITDNV